MATQTILWTVLPYGRVDKGELKGRRRVSVVVSPRLTPQAAGEQTLAAFPEFVDWPGTLGGAKFRVRFGPVVMGLLPLTQPDPGLWGELFKKTTPVAGFQFKDMSKVNLRSYAVRNVLGFLRKHYGRLAVQAASNHPSLLPWRNAHPDLKGMLSDLGTRTQIVNLGDRQIEIPLPGFSRFYGDDAESIEKRLDAQVFGADGIYRTSVPGPSAPEDGTPAPAGEVARRTLPPDWVNPRPQGPNGPLSGAPDAALMDQFASADEYTFYQADRFYRRQPASEAERRLRRPNYQAIPPKPKLPEYDFHRIVASFADYGQLLRALGLVLDFALESDEPMDQMMAAGNGVAKGQIALEIDWTNGHDADEDRLPRTAWQTDAERFFARPRGTDHDRGLLRLENADDGWRQTPKDKPGIFDVYQVDPDGAALKTVGFTLSAQNLVAKSLSLRNPDGEVTYTTGDRQPVAALRSGGLGVSRHGRAGQVVQDAAAAALKNAAVAGGGSVVMFAEDVLRGYRVDVSPVPDATAPGKWLSLCRREGRYKLIDSGKKLKFDADEGHVSGASTSSSADPAVNADDHYLHESLFRWTGWSLCAPRPGLVLRATEVPDTQLQGERPTKIEDVATDGNGLLAEFVAMKGTLPKLRFGQLYRFRARAVDVAGNSLVHDDPTLDPLEQATDAVGYWRFEPIDPPAMVHRSRVSEGESLERMVIRSNFDAGASAYLTTPDFAATIALPASQDFEYGSENERHLVPPKASQQQCEQHGMFDPLWGDPHSIREAYAIAAREAGTLFDEAPGAQVELITPSRLAEVATTTAVPPELPSAENPVGDRLSGGQYVVHREASVETPYLPDPAAGGVALRAQPGHSLPGVTAEMVLGPSCAIRLAPNEEFVILVTHRGDWPKSQGFRLILAERPASLTELPCAEAFPDEGTPKWDEDARTLTLFVSKGRIVRLLYASFAHPALVKTFGVPQWTTSSGAMEFVLASALMGCNWLLTPFRPLVLVHATQAPICLPELEVLSLDREPGAHHVDLRPRKVRLHGPSSGKIEVEAEWHEWRDDLERPGPERILHKAQLGEIQLTENHPNEFNLQAVVDAQIVDPQRPRARGDRHELGDTRFRMIAYRLRATTRFREYLPPSLYAQRDLVTRLGPVASGPSVIAGADDDPGAPVLRQPGGTTAKSWVPASAPPDDPRVLYVVPTFRWTQSGTPTQRNLTRYGNGLRVWLDRPWFSSGDGELLGVVIQGDGVRFTDVPAAMQPFVTQWGLDPIWGTSLPKNKTSIADLPARVAAEAVQLRERPNDPVVQIVGHRVHWDPARRLWYADIELDPGAAYMPFVRLALVRYQPNALPGAKVSKVVMTEFAQLLPRRRAVLNRQGSTASVALHGPVPVSGSMLFPVESEYADISFVTGAHETGRNRVELVFQTHDPAIDSDLGWSDVAVLSAGDAGAQAGGGSGFPPFVSADTRGLFAGPATAAPDERTVELRAGGELRLAASVDVTAARVTPRAGGAIDGPIVGIPIDLDPAIWTASATLPGADGKPARLMLREFERYYTDRTVPETRSGAVRQRRVIEERLVYAAIFDL